MVSLTIISETNKCLFASHAKQQRFASTVVKTYFCEVCLISKTYLTFLYTVPYWNSKIWMIQLIYVVATQHLTIIQSIIMHIFKCNIWYFVLYRLLHHAPIHLCNQALSHTSTLRLISDCITLSIWEIYTCVLRRCSITSNRSNNLRLKVVSG